MVDHPHNHCKVKGKSISRNFCKACKYISQWNYCTNAASKAAAADALDDARLDSIRKPNFKDESTRGEQTRSNSSIGNSSFKSCNESPNPSTPSDFGKHRSFSNPLARNGSRRAPTPTSPSLRRSKSRHSTSSPNDAPPRLSRTSSTPIWYSSSIRRTKPPAIERILECTLEELCFGQRKNIKITRDVLTNTGEITKKEENLSIEVKPGWKKGTKITFEGMGNERLGVEPVDVTFVVEEKPHPLYVRDGNDLEMTVEIPLIQALTGCTLLIPLLGGSNMNVGMDDIIYPGYQKIISEQGMPISKQQGKRGDLRIKFLVAFPTNLSDEQKSDVLSILQDSS